MSVRSFRCAVYTRKSTEDGLEQNFNSLHAQREACEAYIRSQASEGWQLIKGHYDDGGISGATMERLPSNSCFTILPKARWILW
jgi:site-specific DNA recombinase